MLRESSQNVQNNHNNTVFIVFKQKNPNLSLKLMAARDKYYSSQILEINLTLWGAIPTKNCGIHTIMYIGEHFNLRQSSQ